MKKELISVIIVEYNSLNEIELALESIRKVSSDLKYNLEIIISSNSLYNQKKQLEIKKIYTNCVWLFNIKNGGFACAINQGLNIASGDSIIISNPDVVWEKGISDMLSFFYKYSEVGAIAPAILSNNYVRQDSFRSYITPFRFIVRHLRRCMCSSNSVENVSFPRTVDWVIGAFIVIKREAFIKVGLLDENYFLYCEDMDWCTRIRKAGFEIVYYPEAGVIYEGTRSARKSLRFTRIFLKSLFYYWSKFGLINTKPKRKELCQLKVQQ